MPERRMISKRIVSSARFLKMPPTSRELYFHLCLNADDDGIVEGFTVVRQIGATEDDLTILVAKEFRAILNEELVIYINDWMEQNSIRADRYISSRYQGLLLQILPDVPLHKNNKNTLVLIDNHISPDCQPDDNQAETTCQPDDNQMTAQDSIGKGRLVEVSIGQIRDTTPLPPSNSEKPAETAAKAAETKAQLREIRDKYVFNPELNKAVNDWIRYKHENRKAYKPKGLQSLLSQVQSLAMEHGEEIVIQAIRESIASTYMGFIKSIRELARIGVQSRASPGAKSGNYFLNKARELQNQTTGGVKK